VVLKANFGPGLFNPSPLNTILPSLPTASHQLLLGLPTGLLLSVSLQYSLGHLVILHPHHMTHPLVKVKVKVKFTLLQATKFQRGSRGITLLFL
jgi:hypothetical protein